LPAPAHGPESSQCVRRPPCARSRRWSLIQRRTFICGASGSSRCAHGAALGFDAQLLEVGEQRRRALQLDASCHDMKGDHGNSRSPRSPGARFANTAMPWFCDAADGEGPGSAARATDSSVASRDGFSRPGWLALSTPDEDDANQHPSLRLSARLDRVDRAPDQVGEQQRSGSPTGMSR